ncbi:tyrosine--tRNA ligase [Gemmata sp. JC673]|uniref:Tyrosine--tRNA ligase n=1 Tax=Gemmata algarum TaxID=2975278 RepID=A0ABU5F2G5_9BACT|nr:tyrosine--tRNA ligase [Gemmata algarum]MDY3560054.1 tyrosine--tRNA ligase [Gemmata algarum]
MSFPPVDEQLAVLTRGAAQFDGSMREELKKKLEKSFTSGKPLRVKYGIDPTGFDVHLGHTVPLRKLRQFQEFGHTAVLIIGTATAAVGDPSGRDASRQGLTTEQIDKNAQTYLTQIAKVVDVSKAEVRPNGEWFSKFTFADMLKLLGHTTMQRMIERDDFTKRIKAGAAIYLHECLYPLMQGHDSVEIRADVELGGTEQLYNLMVGRDLQRAAGQEPQICLTMPILRGTDGEKKMGKSVGNYIGLNEPAKDMFGKTMRIPDALLKEWFELLTDRPEAEIASIVAGHPNEAKKMLASDIVTFYHGPGAAGETVADWNKQFSNSGAKQDPDNIDDVRIPADKIKDGAMLAVDLIAETKLTASKGEARRKIEEGAFNYGPDRTKPADVKATVPVADGLVVRLGRKILRVRLN